MRVLHVDSGREYRGGQDQARLLVRELAAMPGVEQRVLTKRGSELAKRAAGERVAVREIPWGLGLDPRAWWRLGVESMLWRPHILHAHNNHAATLALWARRFHSWAGPGEAPRVVATRRVVFPLRAGSALRRADAVIAVSRAVSEVLLAAGVPPGEIAIVHDGVDPDEIRRAAAPALNVRATLGLPAETPLVANVAALEPSKDQATLIRAAHAAQALRPDLHWLIAGEGPERRSLASEVRRLQLTNRVHLLGHVARADALMRESDVVVMSSRSEGLGSVVLHALALGKAVVATAAGGLPEVVPSEWIVPVGDAAALARKVIQALDRPPHLPLPAQFTASAMATGVLAVYRSLV